MSNTVEINILYCMLAQQNKSGKEIVLSLRSFWGLIWLSGDLEMASGFMTRKGPTLGLHQYIRSEADKCGVCHQSLLQNTEPLAKPLCKLFTGSYQRLQNCLVPRKKKNNY